LDKHKYDLLPSDPKLMGGMDKHQARDQLGQEESSSEESSEEEGEDPEEVAERKRQQKQVGLAWISN
jgi:hypothetical protein